MSLAVNGRRCLSLLLLALISVGCGGGSATSASSPGGGGGGSQTPAAQTTATFDVNVASGKVTVVASKVSSPSVKAGHLAPQAVFLGDTITFNSSDLIDEGGVSTGQRTMSVTMTNNFGLALGTDPNANTTGLQVIFSPITNLTAPANIEGQTNVSTFAGTGGSGTSNGPATLATFTSPQGIAINSQNAIFVTDAGRVREIQSGSVTTLAGGGTSANPDGLGGSAYFGAPAGIAVNPVDGSLIVADQTLNKIRHITLAGLVSTIAGTGSAGGNNGGGTVATFSSPTGVAIDTSGNIYISETTGSRIRKIVFAGGDPTQAANYTVSTVTGTGAVGGTDGPNGVATFHAPYEIALDGNGGLYVADSGNNRIRLVDVHSGAVTTIAGTGAGSDVDGNGAAATFSSPRGITWSNGALFVAEATGEVIRQISLTPGGAPSSSSSWTVQTLAGMAGAPGSLNGAGNTAFFTSPVMLAASPGGSLFIADSANHLIRRVTPSTGNFPIGSPTFSNSGALVTLTNPDGTEPDQGSGEQPYLIYPGQLASNATSPARLWSFAVPNGVTEFTFSVTVVASTQVTAVLDSVNDGTNPAIGGAPDVYVRTIAGNWRVFGHANGPAATATFQGSDRTAIDAAGDIFVSDQSNNEIRRISPSGNVTLVAGSTTAGSSNGVGNVARFSQPIGIAVTPDGGTIFVADLINHEIRCVELLGSDPTIAGNWTVSTIIGNGSPGGNYTVDTPGNLATLYEPAGLAYNPASHVLYFSEYMGNRIREAILEGPDPTNAANWTVSLVAGDASQINGNHGTTNGAGTSSLFYQPSDVAIDSGGNIYVADVFNNLIRKITSGNIVSTIAGNGTGGFADGPAANAEFNEPVDVAVDGAGDVFIADLYNYKIRELSPAGLVTTVAGVGYAAYANGPANVAVIVPETVSLEPDGTLIVGDYNADIRSISRSFSNSTVGP